jgi:L-asparaginase
MKIKLLITGGTIDKTYNHLTGELGFTKTNIRNIINQSRTTIDIATEVLFLKDSLDFEDSDRNLILNKCINSEEKHILISHGTDSMVKTANLLALNISGKTIVLFGAMIPYSINNSDSLFNFGTALCAIQTKKIGTYIAMNGRVFDYNKVDKNRKLGIFKSV